MHSHPRCHNLPVSLILCTLMYMTLYYNDSKSCIHNNVYNNKLCHTVIHESVLKFIHHSHDIILLLTLLCWYIPLHGSMLMFHSSRGVLAISTCILSNSAVHSLFSLSVLFCINCPGFCSNCWVTGSQVERPRWGDA